MDFCMCGAGALLGRVCRSGRHVITIFLMTAFLLVVNTSDAVTARNYTGFQYDESGNLISIESEVSNQPLQITSIITLTSICIGSAVAENIIGIDLRSATTLASSS